MGGNLSLLPPSGGGGGGGSVQVTASVLPTGAATEATLATLNAKAPALIGGRVPVDGSAVTQPTSATAVSTSGPIAALNQSVVLAVGGSGGVAFDVRGTFSGTVSFQGSVDGITFIALPVTPFGSTSNVNAVSSSTVAGAWIGGTSGAVTVRAIFTAFTSGTATVTIRGIAASPWSYIASVGSAINVSIGTGSIAAGTNLIGDVGLQARGNSTGASASASVNSTVVPAAVTVKGTGGRVFGWQLTNVAATLRSVKVFNTAAPVLGTTAAAYEINILPNTSPFVAVPVGIGFTAAFSYSVTSAKGLTDNTLTGLALGDVTGSFFFA